MQRVQVAPSPYILSLSRKPRSTWPGPRFLPTWQGFMTCKVILIHEADPQSRPVVIIVFCTCRPSVRQHFSKQNKFQAKTMFYYWQDCGSDLVDHWWHMSCIQFFVLNVSHGLVAFIKIDPLGRPTIPAGSDHYFCTCCQSVRPHFSNLAKQNYRK